MKWQKDENGHWCYGDWCVEPFYLHQYGEYVPGGYLICQWRGKMAGWRIRDVVAGTMREAKALIVRRHAAEGADPNTKEG
jgi:hypothetical protein